MFDRHASQELARRTEIRGRQPASLLFSVRGVCLAVLPAKVRTSLKRHPEAPSHGARRGFPGFLNAIRCPPPLTTRGMPVLRQTGSRQSGATVYRVDLLWQTDFENPLPRYGFFLESAVVLFP